jgi:hypothetical protein
MPGALDGLGGIQSAFVKELERSFYFRALLDGETGAKEPGHVDSDDGVQVGSQGKRRDILGEAAFTPRKGELPDTHMLVKNIPASDIRVVLHFDMSCKEGVIRHDNMVADHGVMRKMGTHHEVIVVPHRSGAVMGSASMDGAVFANIIVITNDNLTAHLGIEGVVLRLSSYDCAIANDVVPPHAHGTHEDGVCMEDASGPMVAGPSMQT